MDLYATNSAPCVPPHHDASLYPAVSHLRGGFARGWPGEQFNHVRGRKLGGPTRWGGLNAAVEITPPEAVVRHRRTWHGMAAETTRATEQSRIESRFCAPAHLLVLFEEGTRKDGFTFVQGLPRSALRDCRRKLIFVPSGHEYFDERESSGVTRAAYFYFDRAALPVDPDLGSREISFAPRLFFEDDGLWDTAIKLKLLIESPQANDRLYCESLSVVLAHELVRQTLGAPRVEATARGGLAGWQQGAVVRHIEEHLAEQVPLATLAQIARLSPYHFCRAFKRSFGVPPHRFHMRRRIERAKSLLANPAASVTSVGLAVGFCETSSFSAAFRKATGVTPSGFQRSIS
jgi:AraC family transcriptional regulator